MNKKVLYVVALILFTHNLNAQSDLNIGIGVGPVLSLPSFSAADKSKIDEITPSVGVYGALMGQYIFKNKLGLETGFKISLKDYYIKPHASSEKSQINLDSFSFPFLFLLKLQPASNPYINFNFLLGPVIEFPHYLSSNKNKPYMQYYDRQYTLAHIAVGARIVFLKGQSSYITGGIIYNYATAPPYKYKILPDQESFNPKVHFLELDLIFFFYHKGV